MSPPVTDEDMGLKSILPDDIGKRKDLLESLPLETTVQQGTDTKLILH